MELCAGVSSKPNALLNIIELKKYCKNIDITSRELISTATYSCLDGKYKRNDTLRLLSATSGLTTNQIYYIYKRYGLRAIRWIVESLIDNIQTELMTWDIKFLPIWYREKIDPSSGKIRRIGIQNIKQQIYDYIAVEGLKPLFVCIGEHQYASIEGRGALKGARVVRRWLRNNSIRYAAKADVKKCYENIDRERLMGFLERHVKNDTLLKLVRHLIYTFEQGLSIGSYLSQYLCNLYMSILYHEVMERMYKTRKHRNGTISRVNLVRHALFYMDDILLLGTCYKDIKKALKLVIKKAKDMGLEIKGDYQIYQIGRRNIDMMGYKIHRDRLTIRGRVFLRARRAYRKAYKFYKTHHRIPPELAKKCISYCGYFKNTDSRRIGRKLKVRKVMKLCKGVVRNESKICRGATAS